MQAPQQSPPSKLHPALLTSSLQASFPINSSGPGQSVSIRNEIQIIKKMVQYTDF